MMKNHLSCDLVEVLVELEYGFVPLMVWLLVPDWSALLLLCLFILIASGYLGQTNIFNTCSRFKKGFCIGLTTHTGIWFESRLCTRDNSRRAAFSLSAELISSYNKNNCEKLKFEYHFDKFTHIHMSYLMMSK